MPHRTRQLLAVVILVLLSCKNPFQVSDCPDELQITVGEGPTPEIDWTPRCHLFELSVESVYERSNEWTITGRVKYRTCGDGRCDTYYNTLYPPIRYGAVPRDASQAFPLSSDPTPTLNIGWPYTVRLSRSPAPAREVWLAESTFYATAAPTN
jgi:hypothetical protein